MSKPFAFGIGKPKTKTVVPTKFSLGSTALRQKPSGARSTLDDSDHEDEDEPKHEAVTGFSADGAVLSKPAAQKQERVIQNAGNGDWRNRGKTKTGIAPNGDAVIVVERNEVSTASGLQLASSDNKQDLVPAAEQLDKPQKEPTEDDEALAALLDGGSSRAKSKAVIVQKGNSALGPRDEIADFRADVASRPDSSTLQDYAAMPVEEFGMAMLRGMGKKRRANGEVIDLNGSSSSSKNEPKSRKHDGFLGIGAKPAPGSDIELGAWGKADMRKNNKGDGFFIPLMRVNEKTGEKITEEELQRRIKDQKSGRPEEDSRADRRRRKHGSSDEDDEAHDRSKHDSRRRDGHDRRDRRHDSSSGYRSRHRDRERGGDRDRDRDRDRERDRERDKEKDSDRERRNKYR